MPLHQNTSKEEQTCPYSSSFSATKLKKKKLRGGLEAKIPTGTEYLYNKQEFLEIGNLSFPYGCSTVGDSQAVSQCRGKFEAADLAWF